MKDRLEELQQKAQEFSEAASENTISTGDDDFVVLGIITPEAVLFEEEPIIENILSESQLIEDDITVLETEVQKFTRQQKTLVAAMRRFSVMKKESSITRDIKLQAESLHRRLNALSKQVQKSEEQHGPTAVPTRIQRFQHAALQRKFQQVMRQYNEGLLSKQERCRHFIIRQLEVSGRDVMEEEVDDMVATGKWEVFNENLLNDVRITRSQLSEIEQRHKEMLSLENNMKELRDLYMDIFMLVEEQGTYIEHIQSNVERTQDFVAASNEKFKMAARLSDRKKRRKMDPQDFLQMAEQHQSSPPDELVAVVNGEEVRCLQEFPYYVNYPQGPGYNVLQILESSTGDLVQTDAIYLCYPEKLSGFVELIYAVL